tara:strand:+ start:201 stop:1559 length:1359 start_codon:yes stop_codon:yes gene_type:complete
MTITAKKFSRAFQDWLKKRKIEEVECIISDLSGVSRGKAMPWLKFQKGGKIFLPESIFYQTISGDYVDMDIKGQWTEADMLLVPDYQTAVCCPWTDDVTLQVIHDVYTSKGSPHELVPRNILKKVLDLYHKKGWKPVIAPEMEFYLINPNTDPTKKIEPSIGRSGRIVASRQTYSMMAVDEYGPVIDDIYEFAEAQGFEIDTMIQEGGAGQVEINLVHGDPLKLADQVFLFKRSIREAALKQGCFATFMAKPMEEQPGSAMHIHQSVVDLKNSNNLFCSCDDQPSKFFYWFLGGHQRYIPNALCMMAPNVNSYRRYIANHSAPINLEWAKDNRTTGLRIPVSEPKDLRVENRVVGMDCNPYLAIAASLACGYLGMVNKIEPREPVEFEAYDMERALPRSLSESLDVFENSLEMKKLFGKNFCNVYGAVKRHEAEAFMKFISPWEREHLLLNV